MQTYKHILKLEENKHDNFLKTLLTPKLTANIKQQEQLHIYGRIIPISAGIPQQRQPQ